MKISIHNRDYTLFDVEDNVSDTDINPIELKLFDGDVFTYENDSFQITDSPVRNTKYLTGVLKLDDGKTYGRTNNNKRLLYKCMPNNKKLPFFLIPYDINIGFNKKHKNKFILFKFSEWNFNHPCGTIIETIGDIDDLESLYAYNLYSNSLNYSLKPFIQQVHKINDNNVLKTNKQNKSNYIFSIDPINCHDFDDAFSITKLDNNIICVSVYITEIVSSIDHNNLWSFFTERVATIYLPNKKLNMIPKSYSESCLSLQENKNRRVIKLDFFFNEDGTLDVKLNKQFNITITEISVDKNFVYEDESLVNNPSYKLLLKLSKLIDKTIKNSHDLVSLWMVKTNEYCAKFLKQGIFRKSVCCDDLKVHLDEWKHLSSEYVLYNPEYEINPYYVQVTSPIRRIVDLLNQIVLCNLITEGISVNATTFLNKWLNKIDEITRQTKKIKKVQLECSLLNYFKNKKDSKENYEGEVVKKDLHKKRMVQYNYYTIYVSELKLFTTVSTLKDVEMNKKLVVKFYLFTRESDLSHKVRSVIVD
jgi:exoribonuclease R